MNEHLEEIEGCANYILELIKEARRKADLLSDSYNDIETFLDKVEADASVIVTLVEKLEAHSTIITPETMLQEQYLEEVLKNLKTL